MTVEIRPPRESDDRGSFSSGDAALDLYFHRYAGQNQFRHHVGVTYVATDGTRIFGFLTVAPAMLEADALPTGRRMPPYPIPVLRVARLAIDAGAQGTRLGEALLRHALELAERMRDELGCVGVLVDSKFSAVGFYESFGFVALGVLEGAARQMPPPRPMYLPLGAIPRPRRG